MEIKELTLDELRSVNGGINEAFELGLSHGRTAGKGFWGAAAIIGCILLFRAPLPL